MSFVATIDIKRLEPLKKALCTRKPPVLRRFMLDGVANGNRTRITGTTTRCVNHYTMATMWSIARVNINKAWGFGKIRRSAHCLPDPPYTIAHAHRPTLEKAPSGSQNPCPLDGVGLLRPPRPRRPGFHHEEGHGASSPPASPSEIPPATRCRSAPERPRRQSTVSPVNGIGAPFDSDYRGELMVIATPSRTTSVEGRRPHRPSPHRSRPHRGARGGGRAFGHGARRRRTGSTKNQAPMGRFDIRLIPPWRFPAGRRTGIAADAESKGKAPPWRRRRSLRRAVPAWRRGRQPWRHSPGDQPGTARRPARLIRIAAFSGRHPDDTDGESGLRERSLRPIQILLGKDEDLREAAPFKRRPISRRPARSSAYLSVIFPVISHLLGVGPNYHIFAICQ